MKRADLRLVSTDAGALLGRAEAGVRVFRSVPYAAPPVGPLRWKPPRSPEPWDGEREAFAFGPMAWQPPSPGDPGVGAEAMDEDCLTLNVFAPEGAPSGGGPWPVLVWVHGGAFTIGSGSAPLYDGRALARRGLVVVTLNYRLGRLGFLDHSACDGGEPGVNYGLMDIAAALRWVQANIAAFGGDPDQVTLAGESAGGAAVLRLMSAPERPPFQRALVLSGLGAERAPSRAEARARAAHLFPGDAEVLRALDPQALLQPRPDFYGGDLLLRDDHMAPQDPGAAFAAGRQAAVPLMIGAVSREIAGLPGLDAYGGLLRDLPNDWLARLRALYREAPEPDAALASDLLFVEPARRLADLHARRAPAFLYHFDGHEGGTRHAGELPHLFGNLPPGASAADRALSGALIAHVIAFATDGAPGKAWSPHQPGADRRLLFHRDGPRMFAIPDVARLDLVRECRDAQTAIPGR